MTKIYKSLRLIALTLLAVASAAPSMHGMQRLRAFTSCAATAVKKQIVNLKPQTKLAFAAGTIAAPTALLYHQRPLQFGTTVHAQTAHVTPQSKQDEKTSPEERARIAQLIDEHIDEVLQILKKEGTKEFTWLPGYFVKHNISRLEGAKIFSECIEKYELKCVTVPDKWLYEIPKARQTRMSQLIIAKKLEGTLDGTMNLAQAQEVSTLLKHAKFGKYGSYYCDAHNQNLLYQTDGRVGFIDTELRGFQCYSYENALWHIFTSHNLHPEAKLFIENEICKSTNIRWA